MSQETGSRITARIVAGAVLVFVGLLFTLDSLGVLHAGRVWDWWPMILVGAGLTRIFRPADPAKRGTGWVLLGVGVFFQLWNLHLLGPLRFSYVWPALLVLLGATLIWQATRRGERSAPLPAGSASTVNEFAMMGGGEWRSDSPDFRGGEVSAIMGGIEVKN